MGLGDNLGLVNALNDSGIAAFLPLPRSVEDSSPWEFFLRAPPGRLKISPADPLVPVKPRNETTDFFLTDRTTLFY